jgi:hypothetical protein
MFFDSAKSWFEVPKSIVGAITAMAFLNFIGSYAHAAEKAVVIHALPAFIISNTGGYQNRLNL